MAVKNSLLDVHNLLVEELEKLADDSLQGEKLEKEIQRSKAIASITKVIVGNARNMIDASKVSLEHGRFAEDDQPIKTTNILLGGTGSKGKDSKNE